MFSHVSIKALVSFGRRSRRRFLGVYALLNILVLCACSGSSSDGASEPNRPEVPNSAGLTELTRLEFATEADSLASGTWRETTNLDFKGISKQTVFGQMIDLDVETDTKLITLLSQEKVSDVVYKTDSCTEDGNVENVGESINLWKESDLAEICSFLGWDEIQERFFKASEGDYKINLICGGTLVAEVSVERLNGETMLNNAEFQQLTIGSETLPSEGACGNFGEGETRASANGISNSERSTSVSLRAPYKNSSLTIELAFNRAKLETAEYLVTPNSLDENENNTVTVALKEKAGVSYQGLSGTVRIDEVNTLNVIGTLNIELNSGDKLEGGFSIKL